MSPPLSDTSPRKKPRFFQISLFARIPTLALLRFLFFSLLGPTLRLWISQQSPFHFCQIICFYSAGDPISLVLFFTLNETTQLSALGSPFLSANVQVTVSPRFPSRNRDSAGFNDDGSLPPPPAARLLRPSLRPAMSRVSIYPGFGDCPVFVTTPLPAEYLSDFSLRLG